MKILTAEFVREILNYRLQNIYNVVNSSRQYLLKFSKPDSKKVLVLDCGNKAYLTEFERPSEQAPSNFVTKLRKHLKTRRLTRVKQLGNDRVLVLEFSEGQFYLVLEFFSAGNILLLDEERKILSLQRLVQDKGNNDRYAVNETYNMFDKQSLDKEFSYERKNYNKEDISSWIKSQRAKSETEVSGKKTKKNKAFSIHKMLFVQASHLSSDLLLKNLVQKGITPSASCFDFENDDEKLDELLHVLEVTEKKYSELLSRVEEGITGCVVKKRNPNFNPNEKSSEYDLEYIMEEFHPFKPYKDNDAEFEFVEIQGYNKTLDNFFSTIESTKHALRVEQQKLQGQKRLEHARQERDKQIQTLIDQQEINAKKGEAIIYHADLIGECKESIIQMLNQQMDWENIEKLIQLEQKKGNRLAKMVKLPLNLKENKINLLLPDPEKVDSFNGNGHNSDSSSEASFSSDSDSDEDASLDSDYDSEFDGISRPQKKSVQSKKKQDEDADKLKVSIDLSLSLFANSRLYFESKKTAESKHLKVEKNTEVALKNVERKIDQDLKRNLKKETDALKHIRAKFWFEKFFWFVTNEGYLCLAGKDESQTDMIYYRYFNDNDCFVSSDVEGSLKVFVKNPFKGMPIPPSTLTQAGIFAMSASRAWTGKVTTSAWMLKGTSISKLDFDGSLISSGNFNYTEEKTYLPPSQLVMGLGFYWLIDEESTAKYRDARVEKEANYGFEVVMDNKKVGLDKLVKAMGSKENTLENNLKNEPPPPTGDQVSTESESAPEPVVEEKESSVDVADEPLAQNPPSETKSSRGRAPKNLRKGGFDSDDEVFDPIADAMRLAKIEEPSSQKPPKVRGKKHKLKKAAKYADQDEEDRRLRMQALGTWKQVEEQKKKAEEEKQQHSQQRQNVRETPKRVKQEELQYRKYLSNDDIEGEGESSINNYREIFDSLTESPLPDDKIIGIVPVFGPWAAFSKFKYKAKIQPGSVKKGKCFTETLNHLLSRKVVPVESCSDGDTKVEHDFLASLKPNDAVAAFTVSKVKLMVGAKKK